MATRRASKSWELRRRRAWRDQGKRDEAQDFLAPIYGRFTEGFDTLDLKEANSMSCTPGNRFAETAPILLQRMSPFVTLWTAPPPAHECHGCGRC